MYVHVTPRREGVMAPQELLLGREIATIRGVDVLAEQEIVVTSSSG